MRTLAKLDDERMKHKLTAHVPKPWAEIINQYLDYLRSAGIAETTIYTRRQHLEYLARRIETPPSEVTSETLITWTGKQPWKRETRRGRTNTFKLFWRYAAKVGKLDNVADDLPKVRAAAGIPRPAPDRVYMRGIMQADQRTRLILRLGAEIGLRRGEISRIHSNDLTEDLVGWSLLVHGKGNKQRTVPLTASIAEDLQNLDYGYAFPGKIDGHLSSRRVGELAAAALDDQWTLHTLRHRFATRTYSIDHDVFAVQTLLGHASAETTRRYVQRDVGKLRDLVNRAAG